MQKDREMQKKNTKENREERQKEIEWMADKRDEVMDEMQKTQIW